MKHLWYSFWRIFAWLLRLAVWFLEYGDLVPLMVLISAVHYAVVLQDHDDWIVAIALGLLVDLGHFRTVRAAVRYQVIGKRTRRKGNWFQRAIAGIRAQQVVRWLMVCVMTAISLAYHQRYYNDWWLSVPLPLLIAFLAWQQRVDRNLTERMPALEPAPPVEQPALEYVYVCGVCGHGSQTSQAHAGHMRSHAQAKRNGPPSIPGGNL